MGSIEAALAALELQDTPNYAQTAKKFGVNRSTLSRRHRGVTDSKAVSEESHRFLNNNQELELVKYINHLCDRGIPPTPQMLRNFAADLCGSVPSKDWPARFVKRHENTLKSTYLEGLDLSRKKAESYTGIKRYFELISAKIAEYDIQPHNIYNMDEKGFLLGKLQKMKRVVSKEQIESGKLIGSGQDGSREWITLLACICMDCTALPPAIIYQAQTGNLQDSWLKDYDPGEQCAFFASSPNGWTSVDLGFHWLTRIFDRNTKKKARLARDPRLLFVDGHGSHINMKFLNWCEQNNVLVALYPAHTTHRLQPLDVSVFGPLANFYSQNLDNWIQCTAGLSRLSKREFWSLFYPAFQASFTEENIESGFRKTGLSPLDPEAVLQQIKPPSQQRPASSSDSGKSTLSNTDLSKIRRAARQGAIQGTNEALAKSLLPKLIDRADRVETENKFLRRQLAAAQLSVRVEKRRRKRGKPLFDNLFEIMQGEAAFFSPNKIQAARRKQQEQERAQQEATAKKAQSKLQKQQQKEAKQQSRAQKKIERQKAKSRRENGSKDGSEFLEAAQHLQQEVKPASKTRVRNTKTALTKPIKKQLMQEQDVVEISSNEGVGASSATARPRRQRQLPKHLRDHDIQIEPFA